MSSRVAVAMSVYKSETAINLRHSLESLYKQIYPSIDIYLQVDGPITKELDIVLNEFTKRGFLYIEYYPSNKGLAFQLNRAIERIYSKGVYNYIARMDSDDISTPDRIKNQIEYLERNPHIAVLGTSILEFGEEGDEFLKVMPESHDVLKKNIVKRCPVNHPTVIFNLNVINKSDLKYNPDLLNTQDYYLWVELLKKGYRFANLKDVGLRFRINKDFHSRRGVNKALNDFRSRVFAIKQLEVHSFSNYLHCVLLIFLRLSPKFIKKLLYREFR